MEASISYAVLLGITITQFPANLKDRCTSHDIAFMVEAPDTVEATLLKATKTFAPTRQYGLAGYAIMLLVPDRSSQHKIWQWSLRGQTMQSPVYSLVF